jgi:hypothetical protein
MDFEKNKKNRDHERFPEQKRIQTGLPQIAIELHWLEGKCPSIGHRVNHPDLNPTGW